MRAVRRAAAVFLGLATMLGLLVSYTLVLSAPADPAQPPAWLFMIVLGVGLSSYAGVGVILVWRRSHPMGLVFSAIGAGLGVGFAASDYTFAAARGMVPRLDLVAWVANWTLIPSLAGGALALLLLFPTGRPASRGWWVVAVSGAATMATWAVGSMLHPRLREADGQPNPLPITLPLGTADTLVEVTEGLFGVILAAAVVGLVRRFISSSGVERQQLKWFTYAGAVTATGFGSLVFVSIFPAAAPLASFGWIVGLIGLSSIPVAAGIAILRYRLYEIDVVIRRTLVYGAVVAILGAVYVSLVLVLQAVLAGVTGGQTLPVALSTLAIAALFGPVRARARDFIDRRFYRSRYDAQRTLEAFSGRLRDRVDVQAVATALTSTAEQAVRPSRVGVWMRMARSR